MELEKAKKRYQQLREQAQAYPALVTLYSEILECLNGPDPKTALREKARQAPNRGAAASIRVAVSILDYSGKERANG